jgi:hypothetical protein
MPYGSVTLVPGVNTERTPTLLKAGISSSSFIRFKDDLVQKLGGWTIYYSGVAGVPRDLHAWEDLNQVTHLGVGSTAALTVITSGSGADITPQNLISDFAPNFSTTASSNLVTIVDPNINNVTTNDAVYFNVPVSIGGLILFGLYQIVVAGGGSTYEIQASSNATTSETNPTATNNTTAAGNPTLHFAATPAWLVNGMAIYDLTTPSAIPNGTTVAGTGGTTVTMSNNATGAGVGNGDSIIFCSVPIFTPTSGSAVVQVTFIAHGLVTGNTFVFPIATTSQGVTIQGSYVVTRVDANNFTIGVSTQATGNAVFAMNTTGFAELVYWIALGPPAAGTGYGVGAYGSGGYGSGASSTSQTGTEITATDWTQDNWGEILLSCPASGGVFAYDPTSGFANSQIVSTAPPFNGGIFVSVSEQILVAWASTTTENVGVEQDPLLVKWSTVGDYTQFTALATNQAGSFRIPSGNRIVGGIPMANQNLVWTDIDCWAMNYQGPPFVYGFNKIGAGAGLASAHAAASLRGNIYWMGAVGTGGASNFYAYDGSGVHVLPCPVWDYVFQQINPTFAKNVRAIPNTPFNEIGWEFPSMASTSGENDLYVKMNIAEAGAPWDYGSLQRSAWTDQSVLGNPIGANPGGVILQHETSPDGRGNPIPAMFTTGYFYIAEGEDYAFVDQILPDFKWGTFGGSQTANIQMSFNVVNFPGDTPVTYGPYTVTQSTEILSVRFRGRQMSISIGSSDSGSFWRIGKIRYRYAPMGRR